MATIIRLARHGRKGQAFYHIVVADKRFARDARFIEKIGTYNPRTNPATIDLKTERAIEWVQKGAKPTDTVRSILSSRGVLYKVYLLKGVKKGALSQEQAEAKYAQWVAEKQAKTNRIKSSSESAKREAYKKRIASEAASRENRNARRKAQPEVSGIASTSVAEQPSVTGNQI